MSRSTPRHPDKALPFWLLIAFLLVLFVAGGASRADAMGQVVCRLSAWGALIILATRVQSLNFERVKPVALLLILATIVVALQLLPLPPSIWTALSGRALLAAAAEVSGQPQPWRPISMSPSGTANALGSLIVPATALILAAGITAGQRWRLLAFIISLVLAGCLLSLVQASGSPLSNPFINQVKGSIAGPFANRNHFALLVAFGCLLCPVWGFCRPGAQRWHGAVGLAMLPLFWLTILVVGSRMGLLVGAVATASGLYLARAAIGDAANAISRRSQLLLATVGVASATGVLVAAIKTGRGVAVDRALAIDAGSEMRSEALPYVAEAIVRYFPFGSGFGTFDPVYRIGEPDFLLQPTYFNHAHNDWMEVAMDGGIGGILMLVSAVAWAAVTAIKVGRIRGADAVLGSTGAAGIALIGLASLTDYPARTPIIMALLIMFATWLQAAGRSKHRDASGPDRCVTLPRDMTTV